MHIAIVGNIGAGKTTLAKKLADHYDWEVLYEAVDNNPYLADFYDNMSRWSFHLQIFFLNSRFEQILKIQDLKQEKTIIQDRSIYEDAHIFAKNLYDEGLFDPTDYQTYKNLFDSITQAIVHPDLMIYLKADIPKLSKQINKRGRAFEKNIDINYLKSLNELYENFTKNYTFGKLLTIDVNELDYAENPNDFEFIVNQIDNQLNAVINLH